MINALICAHKCGDVIGLALRQLVDAECVTRILLADGPHCGKTFGTLVGEPSVKAVAMGLRSSKIVYRWIPNCRTLAEKCNRILPERSPDCQWVLVVDGDEVYHEDSLDRLPQWLANAEYDRYSIKTLDLYPDFHHFIKIGDWKPRLYRWLDGACCPAAFDDGHQYILHARHRLCETSGLPDGLARMPSGTCTVYHLNALRSASGRVVQENDGTVTWHGGGRIWRSAIYPFDIGNAPKCIRELGRRTL